MPATEGPSRESDPHDPRLEPLVESFLARERRGERPSISEYVEKHPELAEQIRRLFPALISLEGIEEGSTGPVSPETPVSLPVWTSGIETRRLGEYRILREIGRGGMGVVYEAEQESLGRRVALKVLHAHASARESFKERFRREARAAAALQHPNIVPIHGAGEQDGIHYYTMQLVEGEGLDKVLSEVKRFLSSGASGKCSAPDAGAPGPGRLSSSIAMSLLCGRFDPSGSKQPARGVEPADPGSGPLQLSAPQAGADLPASTPLVYMRSVARVGCQAAGALSYAHEKGILHRDIKPSNLILDTRGTILVADFGLAKMEGLEELTQSGEVLGTLLYMAPEQFRGAPDRRSDIYSLGLTLYELLSLQAAFSARDRGALVREILEGEPVRLRKVNPGIPEVLEAIVIRAICKDPDGRYQSAGEMAGDLECFLSGRSVPARLPGAGVLLRRFTRRRRPRLVLSALAAAAVITVLAAWMFTGKPEVVVQTTAVRPEIKADSYEVGKGPKSIRAADLDGDGDLDLAMSNGVSNDVSVLLNQGNGIFSPAAHYPSGSLPTGLAVADLNGDGLQDLAVVHRDSKDLVVLRNQGKGTFEKAASIKLEEQLFCIAPIDLDKDGRTDLAVATGENHVRLLRNRGEGGLESGEACAIGNGPIGITAADLNGDGSQDLVVTYSRITTTISILWSRGGGAFEEARSYEVERAGFNVEAADLDGDQDLDLAGGSVFKDPAGQLKIENFFWILWNQGKKSFSNARIVQMGVPVQFIAAGELDGIPGSDLVTAGGSTGIRLLQNGGGGRFLEALKLDRFAGQRPNTIALADLNGDRLLDLAVTNFASHTVSVILNQSGLFPAR